MHPWVNRKLQLDCFDTEGNLKTMIFSFWRVFLSAFMDVSSQWTSDVIMSSEGESHTEWYQCFMLVCSDLSELWLRKRPYGGFPFVFVLLDVHFYYQSYPVISLKCTELWDKLQRSTVNISFPTCPLNVTVVSQLGLWPQKDDLITELTARISNHQASIIWQIIPLSSFTLKWIFQFCNLFYY